MPSTAKDNQGKWTYTQISEARKQLQTYYSDQQNQQMTRLLGFVVGLFTLLQVTQSSKSSPLSSVFPHFPSASIKARYAPFWLRIGWLSPAENWDFLKVVFLFLGVSLILYFILRTIFRYALYGNMASWVMNIKYDNVMEYKDKGGCNEMYALNHALSEKIYDDANIFWIFPANWFFKVDEDTKYPSREKCGYAVCMFISIVTSLLLLLFLW
jgi:hypothetical protein